MWIPHCTVAKLTRPKSRDHSIHPSGLANAVVVLESSTHCSNGLAIRAMVAYHPLWTHLLDDDLTLLHHLAVATVTQYTARTPVRHSQAVRSAVVRDARGGGGRRTNRPVAVSPPIGQHQLNDLVHFVVVDTNKGYGRASGFSDEQQNG